MVSQTGKEKNQEEEMITEKEAILLTEEGLKKNNIFDWISDKIRKAAAEGKEYIQWKWEPYINEEQIEEIKSNGFGVKTWAGSQSSNFNCIISWGSAKKSYEPPTPINQEK